VWGLEYRYSISHTQGDLTESLVPANVTSQSFSSFAQDEIALVPERFYLTLGTKLQRSYYTGFALMPSARASYAPSSRHTLWAAVSRAYRTPAAFDTSIRLNFGGMPGLGGTPVLVAQIGNPNFKNEGLTAYELGYRAVILRQLSMDVTSHYNAYDHQQTVERGTAFLEPTPLPAHVVEPTTFQNLMDGETHGLEITANWKISDRWTLSPSYDFERVHMHTSALSQDTETVLETEGSDPHMHARLRSHVSLAKTLAWDASAYFVDRLEALGVPSYTRLDTGLSWRWSERISLSLVGQNLLRDHHLEFADDVGRRATLIKRTVCAKLTWQF
jgi:iron complex outermembrane recepter protein